MGKYRKAIVAVIGAFASGSLSFTDQPEYVVPVAAAITAILVYLFPNKEVTPSE